MIAPRKKRRYCANDDLASAYAGRLIRAFAILAVNLEYSGAFSNCDCALDRGFSDKELVAGFISETEIWGESRLWVCV